MSTKIELENGVALSNEISNNFTDMPKSYLSWSVINMLCGNLFFGIIGFLFSLKVRDTISERKFYESKERLLDEAKKASKRAFVFNLVGTTLTLIVWILFLSLIVFLFLSKK